MKMADMDLAIKEAISTFLTKNNLDNDDDIIDSLSEEFVKNPNLALHFKDMFTLQLKRFLLSKYFKQQLYRQDLKGIEWEDKWLEF